MHKLTESIQAVQQLLHVLKPLFFELALFTWAVVEMARFIAAVAFGGAQ